MITIVVPTYNRAYTLKETLPSFYVQKDVTEIVVIDDCGTDDTHKVVEQYSKLYPNIKTIYSRNERNMGAAYSRNRGVELGRNEYILFCDDDDILASNYAEVCLKKIITGNASIVSGRHFYRQLGESVECAKERFGNGVRKGVVLDRKRFKLNTEVEFEGDLELPFTHGILLTTRDFLIRHPLDSFYSKGNGYREETDFQVSAYVNGHKIVMTNETYCVALDRREVKTGGQRVNRLKRFYYTVRYTSYFLNKYYKGLRSNLGIPYGLSIALTLFSIIEFYVFFVRPIFILPGRIIERVRN